MNKQVPNFNRLDKSRGQGTPANIQSADHLAYQRATPEQVAEYRAAWIELSQREPGLAIGFPHPDRRDFDVAKALAELRLAGGPVRAVPPRGIQA